MYKRQAVVRKEVLPYAHLSSNPIVKIGQKVVNKLIYEKESLVFIKDVYKRQIYSRWSSAFI